VSDLVAIVGSRRAEVGKSGLCAVSLLTLAFTSGHNRTPPTRSSTNENAQPLWTGLEAVSLLRALERRVMSKSYTCRYCDTAFVPRSGKPGYIDECPECLHEKTHPKPPPDLVSRFMARNPERVKIVKDLRKSLVKIGLDESRVDDVIADFLVRSGTQI
jgi:hypothetical protein